MDLASGLFRNAAAQAVEQDPAQLVETVGSAPIASLPLPFEAFALDDEALEAELEPSGLADLRAAIGMVASGGARSVTLCGFADSHELLQVGRELAIEGLALEPVIRRGGGGFDIRVRQIP